MKKTDLVTKIVSALVFLALVIYLGVYFWRSVKDPVVTAIAVETTVRTEFQVSGIALRSEQLVESDAAYLSLSVSEGERVARDSAVAMAYGDKAAMERAEQIRQLETEIRQTEAMLDQLISAEELNARDEAIEAALLRVTGAVARHELTELEDSGLNLASLVFTNMGESATAGDLIMMRSELERLRRSTTQDIQPVTASAAGIFSTLLDGYEHLSPEQLQGLTPAELKAMMEDDQAINAAAIGKLVSGNRWYFAALMRAEDVKAGGEALGSGRRVRLELGRYYGTPLSARVESVGQAVDGECVVVFSCDRALADTMAMRVATAEVVVSENSGIRVPKQAVHTEETEEGETIHYVFTLTGVQAERKNIHIVWETEDFYLVQADPASRALREGNDIIVSARDLFDGKIME